MKFFSENSFKTKEEIFIGILKKLSLANFESSKLCCLNLSARLFSLFQSADFKDIIIEWD